jgi:hypothetical protein
VEDIVIFPEIAEKLDDKCFSKIKSEFLKV